MHACAGALHQLEDREQRDGLRRNRHAGQTEPRRERAAGGDALAEIAVLRPQPDGVAEGARIRQRALQHLRAAERNVGLAETDAARIRQRRHLGQHFAGEVARERAEREQARAAQLAGAELQHFDQTGLVEHRIGIGRADQAGHAAGNRSGEFAVEHAFVFVARFAQPRRQVDEPRRDDAARRVDGAVSLEIDRHVADGKDLAVANGDIARPVESGSRVDDAAVGDEDVHASFPATMLMTAMRTAMPKVTCGKITLWLPSTTAESISTPRLIGPGCITMQSGLASCSFSGVRP